MHARKAENDGIPAVLRPLFWDCSFDSLQWPADRDFIIARVLSSGEWENVRWLRKTAGDSGIEDWLKRRRGGGLSPERLRFWELVLHIPHSTVDRWLGSGSDSIWNQRAAR